MFPFEDYDLGRIKYQPIGVGSKEVQADYRRVWMVVFEGVWAELGDRYTFNREEYEDRHQELAAMRDY